MKIKNAELSLLTYILFTVVLLIFTPDSISYIIPNLFIFVFVILISRFNEGEGFFYFIRIIYPLFLLSFFYGETAFLNHFFINKNLDYIFMQIDQKVFGFQPALMFSKVYHRYWLSELLNFAYLSFLFMPLFVGILFYRYRKQHFEKVIFTIVTSFLIFYILFIIFPVVGPQFYWHGADAKAVESGFFSKAVKFIQKIAEHPTGAFPSSHVGVSLIISFLLFKYFKKAFYFIAPLSFLILFATVYIKAHYAIDVLGGIVFAFIIYRISNLLWNGFNLLKTTKYVSIARISGKLKKILLMLIAK